MKLQKTFEYQGIWLFRHRGWLPVVVLVPAAFLFWQEQLQMAASTAGLQNLWIKEAICLLLGLVGLFVRVYTIGYSHAGTSGRNTKGQVAQSLNTTGIYSVVRHPLYLGNFLMWFSIALLVGNVWFIVMFFLLFWLFYERIMFTEECFLEEKFGMQFTGWASRVPAFIPAFGKFVAPDSLFSWKRVLRAEKNGLFALFLVFFAFDAAGAVIRGDFHYNYFLMAGCIASAVLYVVLKYLKYKSHVLDV